jgi:hypothetical protein
MALANPLPKSVARFAGAKLHFEHWIEWRVEGVALDDHPVRQLHELIFGEPGEECRLERF